jgi:hypothetical protein
MNELAENLRKLVRYNWREELDDYRKCGDGPYDNQRAGHIFETLVWLDNWLDGSNVKPKDYL